MAKNTPVSVPPALDKYESPTRLNNVDEKNAKSAVIGDKVHVHLHGTVKGIRKNDDGTHELELTGTKVHNVESMTNTADKTISKLKGGTK